MQQIMDFFKYVFNGATGYIELRLIGNRRAGSQCRREFFGVGEYEAIGEFCTDNNGKANIYYGIYPRYQKSGRADDVLLATALFADVDAKLVGSLDKAREVIASFPLKPSVLVFTGHGYQPIYKLKEPIKLTENESNKRLVIRYLKGLQKALQSDHVADLPRILRVPYTLNIKQEPFVEATIVNDLK